MEKLELRLSNLMAFDGTVVGNWGCDPELYPPAIDSVLKGDIKVAPFVAKHALGDINKVIEAARNHELTERGVLVP